MILLHQLPDAKELFEILAAEQRLLPIIVEKDYWIMHCLWGLQQQGYNQYEALSLAIGTVAQQENLTKGELLTKLNTTELSLTQELSKTQQAIQEHILDQT